MDNDDSAFSLNGRLHSVRLASSGIIEMLKSQHNAWVHLVATLCVVLVGLFCGVTVTEWCFLIIAIMVVWVAEALNTALELLCDVASPDFHPLIKKSKDVAAGGVLLSALGAVSIGLIIFAPYLLALL
jgi:diacylglycerol kinase (ATP)